MILSAVFTGVIIALVIFRIEVKSKTGKPRPDQIRFHEFLQSHNVIHGIARNVSDALMIVDGGLCGYGYD